MKSPNTLRDELIERESRPLALIIGNPLSKIGTLPAAEEEASLVTQKLKDHTEFEVTTLTQELATRDIILDSFLHSRIVHIAAHGSMDADEQHIRAGAIHLTDGILFAKDIEVQPIQFYSLVNNLKILN